MENKIQAEETDNEVGNKKKIFDVSLKLFAEKGFYNVSMRDIAKEVGIKASSIYNHYKNKEEILDSIFEYFKANVDNIIYSEITQQLAEEKLDKDFLGKNLVTITQFMKMPIMNDLIKIIVKEQFTSEKIRAFLLVELVEKPRYYFEQYFTKLVEQEVVKPIDPKILTREYQSFLIYQHYANSLIDSTLIDTDRDEKEREEHFRFFWDAIKK
jgi:AcrR family transcriptional regulator